MLLTVTLLSALTAAPLPHDPGLSSIRVHDSGRALVIHAAFANADFAGVVPIDDDRDGRIDDVELTAGRAAIERAVGSGFAIDAPTSDTRQAARLVAVKLGENDDIELVLELAATAATATTDRALRCPILQDFSRGHRSYIAQIDDAGAIQTDALLTPTDITFVVPAENTNGRGFEQVGLFFGLGVEHILFGFDHLAFLLALLVAGITLRRAVVTITAFTVAHSITLVGAAVGLLGLPGLLVESVIAGSIVWVAASNLRASARLGQNGETKGLHRWQFALAFGLVHGFGFAGFLGDLDIRGPHAILPMLSFNLGVEVGQILFALLALPLLWWLDKTRYGATGRTLISIGVGLAGLFWLGERLL